MKYLFVGGCKDGCREESEGMPLMRVVVPRPFNFDVTEYATVPDPEVRYFETQDYRLHHFRDQTGDYGVYMHDVPEGGGMAALIAGYRQPPSTEPPPEDPAKVRAAMERLVGRLEHIKGQRTPEYLRDERPAA